MLRYPPMTEGYIFLPRAVRPEVKKYNPRSEVDHLRIYTDKEVVLLYNFDFIPPFFGNTFFSQVGSGFPPNENNRVNTAICKNFSLIVEC